MLRAWRKEELFISLSSNWIEKNKINFQCMKGFTSLRNYILKQNIVRMMNKANYFYYWLRVSLWSWKWYSYTHQGNKQCNLLPFIPQLIFLRFYWRDRSIKTKIPQIKAYQKEIDEISRDIQRERKAVDNITQKLELPEHNDRKKSFCGKDFTMEELKQKIELYESRISKKEWY